MSKSYSIAINVDTPSGAAGGGIQFAEALVRGLTGRGHRIYRQLVPDLDAIFIVSFRRGSASATFTPDQAAEYKFRYPNTVCLLRVNDSDEARFGVHLAIGPAARHAQAIADHTVFVSNYLRDLYIGRHFDASCPHSIIRNAADPNLFNPEGRNQHQPGEPLRLVTHHWSPAYTKGFDIYERVDLMLGQPAWRGKIDFTVIGALPYGFRLRHARHVPMLFGPEIPAALKQQHAYLTGARGEAAPMHAIEAMQCGLPIFYIDSGALPEYCQGFGLSFDAGNLEQRLTEFLDCHDALWKAWQPLAYGLDDMVDAYERLIGGLVAARREAPLPKPSPLSLIGRGLRHKLGRIRRLRSLIHP